MSARIKDREVCRSCGERKPRTEEFWSRQPGSADGLKTMCNTCNAKAVAKRRENSAYHAHELEYKATYREEHREEIAAYNHEYFARREYKDRRNGLNKTRRASDLEWAEQERQYDRDYLKAHPGYSTRHKHKWRKAYPEKARTVGIVHRHRRRAITNGAEGHYTANDLEHIWQEQSRACANPHCSVHLTKRTRTLDHKRPLARGGSQWPDNLQWLCEGCNKRKGAKLWETFLANEAP